MPGPASTTREGVWLGTQPARRCCHRYHSQSTLQYNGIIIPGAVKRKGALKIESRALPVAMQCEQRHLDTPPKGTSRDPLEFVPHPTNTKDFPKRRERISERKPSDVEGRDSPPQHWLIYKGPEMHETASRLTSSHPTDAIKGSQLRFRCQKIPSLVIKGRWQ